MNRNILLGALLIPALFYVASCNRETSGTDSQAHDPAELAEEHDEHAEEGDHVGLNAAQVEAAGIRTAKAELRSVSAELELPAEIRFDADRVARISPQVEGVVTRLYVGEGDTVKAGARLALLTSRELASLKADFLNAQTTERLAQAELNREEKLFDQNLY